MPTLPNISNLTFAENLYEEFLREPASVPPEWRSYFTEIADGELRFPHPHFGPSFRPFSLFNPPPAESRSPDADGTAAVRLPALDTRAAALQDRLYLLIRL